MRLVSKPYCFWLMPLHAETRCEAFFLRASQANSCILAVHRIARIGIKGSLRTSQPGCRPHRAILPAAASTPPGRRHHRTRCCDDRCYARLDWRHAHDGAKGHRSHPGFSRSCELARVRGRTTYAAPFRSRTMSLTSSIRRCRPQPPLQPFLPPLCHREAQHLRGRPPRNRAPRPEHSYGLRLRRHRRSDAERPRLCAHGLGTRASRSRRSSRIDRERFGLQVGFQARCAGRYAAEGGSRGRARRIGGKAASVVLGCLR